MSVPLRRRAAAATLAAVVSAAALAACSGTPTAGPPEPERAGGQAGPAPAGPGDPGAAERTEGEPPGRMPNAHREQGGEAGAGAGAGAGEDRTSAGEPSAGEKPEPSANNPERPGPSRADKPSDPYPTKKLADTVDPGSPEVTTLTIGDWSRPLVGGGQRQVDACNAAVLFDGPEPGRENGMAFDTAVIVGHDFCGFDVLAPLPKGTRVTISGPMGTLKYRVYENHITPGQGGPNHGLYWGDVTLQTCVGPDTGFSYLERTWPPVDRA